MYHYTLCGLRNVWLENGFEHHDTPYGKGVSIIDAEGLDKAIAYNLVVRKPHLSSAEFRFLRKQLDLSQKGLADIMGVQSLQVSRWETKSPTRMADRFIRHIYAEKQMGNADLEKMIDHLNERDQESFAKYKFKRDSHWQTAA